VNLVIGSTGFIGKHVAIRLLQKEDEVMVWYPALGLGELVQKVKQANTVYHCAGATRDTFPSAFEQDLATTRAVIQNLKPTAKVVYASSESAGADSHYGSTKQQTEIELAAWARRTPQGQVFAPRLPNVFGKWAKPHHNSIVATWCSQIVKGEPTTPLTNGDVDKTWAHIDPVVDCLVDQQALRTVSLSPAEVLDLLIEGWNDPFVVTGSLWASTVWSYAQPKASTEVTHEDDRGLFQEFSKATGQVNWITIKPNTTRGNHFHHNRIEAFVLYGRGLSLQATHVRNPVLQCNFRADSTNPMTIVVPPGWRHELKNNGTKTRMVLLKTNDIFDPQNPDTL